MPSNEEDSAWLPPSGLVAQSENDADMESLTFVKSVRRTHTPWFIGFLFTLMSGKDTHVLYAEILAKDAIEPGPPAEMKKGFYSPQFIVSKKGGKLRPIMPTRLVYGDRPEGCML